MEPCIRAVSFVGSTSVGQIVNKLCTDNGKITQMNMGAKNHAIVLPDANPDHTSSSIVSAACGGAGQRCMALSVVVLVGQVHHILEQVVDKIKLLNLEQDVGSVIDEASRSRVLKIVEETSATKLLFDQTSARERPGYYMNPVVLDHVDVMMPVYQEELFAPVISCVRVQTLDEAIALVNANAYGNGTTIFTNSIDKSSQFEREINVGQIGVNVPVPVPPPYFSWTSSKDSFVGNRHIYGPETFDFYTTVKTIMTTVPIGKAEVKTFMPST